MDMNINELSQTYDVRRLSAGDTDRILALYLTNPMYFEHMKQTPSAEHIKMDMTALPPGVSAQNKYYIGFFDGKSLCAIMDLIAGYPEKRTAFIGLFMVSGNLSGRGIGSGIIRDTATALKSAGFFRIRLGFVKENGQSRNFWLKNDFSLTGEEMDTGDYRVILMERPL